ncbi:MAG TPA: NAD(P)-dependent oxidoreductase [Gaiellaceae bacterium]|nr:NAD(P)-dependent oxidoreductase [Gaiellaceae bacterium]
MRIVVTGGSGRAGRVVVPELREHGHEVLSVDRNAPGPGNWPAQIVDLLDLGQTLQCLADADAVVHLAAIPAPGFLPEGITFTTNMTTTYNVFEAARLLGIGRVVWASSETVYGMPFERPPAYVPFDEQSELRPESSYALSKVLAEELARQFARRAGIASIGIRFSNILYDEDYERLLPEVQADPLVRRVNLWNYVDTRDTARSVRLAVEADTDGAEIVSVAAPDTLMDRPSAELVAEHFPETELRELRGEFGSLISSIAAERLIGYVPRHSWRDR